MPRKSRKAKLAETAVAVDLNAATELGIDLPTNTGDADADAANAVLNNPAASDEAVHEAVTVLSNKRAIGHAKTANVHVASTDSDRDDAFLAAIAGSVGDNGTVEIYSLIGKRVHYVNGSGDEKSARADDAGAFNRLQSRGRIAKALDGRTCTITAKPDHVAGCQARHPAPFSQAGK